MYISTIDVATKETRIARPSLRVLLSIVRIIATTRIVVRSPANVSAIINPSSCALPILWKNPATVISKLSVIWNATKIAVVKKRAKNPTNLNDRIFTFPYVTVEKKLTCDDFLAGITVDWREKPDWEAPRKKIEAYVRKVVSDHNQSSNPLYIRAYSSHPFIDIYATRCDKGIGFKYVLSETKMQNNGQIMYLGDSENDNPAFKMADISIGVRSDPRLKSTRLECGFVLEYDKLASFMQSLLRNDVALSPEGMKILRLRNQK
jgi:hypothetical protein